METETQDQSPAYEERYCAYVDILGFTDLVAKLKSGTISPESISKALRVIHEHPVEKYATSFTDSDFRAASISDAVCLSAKPNRSGLFNIFFVLRNLTSRLLQQVYFIRGAVVKGNLFRDNHMVFGEAFGIIWIDREPGLGGAERFIRAA
jgi:hypothetical protein